MRYVTLLTFTFFTGLILLGTVSAAAAHQYQDYPPSQFFPSKYGGEGWGYGPEFDIGDLVFNHVWQEPSELSLAERYIISGTGPGRDGVGLGSWQNEVYNVVLVYYSRFGTVPPAITPDVLRQVSNSPECLTEDDISRFRSPITEDFPRLDAMDFAAGQVYFRPLTQLEIEHVAGVSYFWRKLLVEHKFRYEDGWKTVYVSPPFYARFYGERGVIADGIRVLFTPLAKPSTQN